VRLTDYGPDGEGCPSYAGCRKIFALFVGAAAVERRCDGPGPPRSIPVSAVKGAPLE
jgi:hypothetical protein